MPSIGREPAASRIAATDAVLVVEPDRNRLVAPRILDHVTAIGGEHQLDAEPLGRLAERARLIPGRRRQQENATHDARDSVTVAGFDLNSAPSC